MHHAILEEKIQQTHVDFVRDILFIFQSNSIVNTIKKIEGLEFFWSGFPILFAIGESRTTLIFQEDVKSIGSVDGKSSALNDDQCQTIRKSLMNYALSISRLNVEAIVSAINCIRKNFYNIPYDQIQDLQQQLGFLETQKEFLLLCLEDKLIQTDDVKIVSMWIYSKNLSTQLIALLPSIVSIIDHTTMITYQNLLHHCLDYPVNFRLAENLLLKIYKNK